MTVSTDQFTQLAHRSQEAFSTAVRVWQDTLRSYPGLTPSTDALPDVHATVDAAFDFAERVLADQREFAKALVSVGTQTFETIADQATQLATQTAGATKGVAHEDVEPPTRQAEQADEPADEATDRDEPAPRPKPVTPVSPAAARRPRTARRADDA
jgi:hypothetical protein